MTIRSVIMYFLDFIQISLSLVILQPEAVGEAIDALFKSIKVPKEKVIISLSGLSFTYRFLNLPRMKPAHLEEAILRAAQKEISLPLDELYLSWQPVAEQDDEQTFFVLGVSRHLIDAMIQTLAVAGIEPYLMDLQPLALTRVANRGDAIVANLEPECFDIVIIAKGLPTVIHTISPRGEGATLEDNIQRLADELTKTVAFYQSSHPENQLSTATPVLLTGELSAEVTTHGLLQAEIEYPVEPLVPTLECPSDLPVAAYTSNIGLALKKIPQKPADKAETARYHDININILTGKYRKPRTAPVPKKYVLLGVLLAAALLLLYPLYQSRSQLGADNIELETRLNAVSREVNLANLVTEETARREATISNIISNTENLTSGHLSILNTKGDYTENLHQVTGVLPPEIYITSISIDKTLIMIQGETENVFTVVEYAMNLEMEEAFREVRITSLDEANPVMIETTEGEMIESESGLIMFEIVIKKSISEYLD